MSFKDKSRGRQNAKTRTRGEARYSNQDKDRWRKVAVWLIPLVFTILVSLAVSGHGVILVWTGVSSAIILIGYTQFLLEWYIWQEDSRTRKRARVSFAILSIIALVFGGILQKRLGSESPAATHLVDSERPELFLSPEMEPLVVGKPATVKTLIENTGKGTAYRINICAHTFEVNGSFEGPLWYLKPSLKRRTIPDILPSKQFVVMVADNQDLMTEERIGNVYSNRGLLFFFGRGSYRDAVGKEYPVRFCYMYAKDMPGSMMICPTQYLAKEDDPNRECPQN